jgi:hypothetical protein
LFGQDLKIAAGVIAHGRDYLRLCMTERLTST